MIEKESPEGSSCDKWTHHFPLTRRRKAPRHIQREKFLNEIWIVYACSYFVNWHRFLAVHWQADECSSRTAVSALSASSFPVWPHKMACKMEKQWLRDSLRERKRERCAVIERDGQFSGWWATLTRIRVILWHLWDCQDSGCRIQDSGLRIRATVDGDNCRCNWCLVVWK